MNHADILYGGPSQSVPEVNSFNSGSAVDRLYPTKVENPGLSTLTKGEIVEPTQNANYERTDPASTLYGGEPAYQPEPTSEVNEDPLERHSRQEKSLYDKEESITLEIPENIKELRNTPERKLTGDNLGNTINQEAFDLGIKDLALAKAVAYESRQVLTDLGFSQHDVPEIGYAAQELEKLGELTNESRTALRQEAINRIRSEHGSNADQVYKDIVKLVHRDPRFAVFLDKSNLGDSPRMASLLGRLAVKARNSGQLS